MQDIFYSTQKLKLADYLTPAGREKIAYRNAVTSLVGILKENRLVLEALSYQRS